MPGGSKSNLDALLYEDATPAVPLDNPPDGDYSGFVLRVVYNIPSDGYVSVLATGDNDTNADGLDDAVFFQGYGSANYNQFMNVNGLGDVNGDGKDDLVFG